MVRTSDCGCIIVHILNDDARSLCIGTDCPYCALEIESETLHGYCSCYDGVVPKL